MKKHATISLALAAIATSVWAQTHSQTTDGLNKRLEVTRAYTPRVERATKLAIAPDMVDTVRLRPEIAYRITPTAWPTAFPVRPFAPAGVATAEWQGPKILYLRVGVGHPLLSTADIYFTPRTRPGSSVGVWFNHRGSFSRLTNKLGDRLSALETGFETGVWGSTRLTRGRRGQVGRYTLDGDLSYDLRLLNPYGRAEEPLRSSPDENYSVLSLHNIHKSSPITWGRIRAGVSVGDDFTDLGRFNFRAGVEASYSHGADHAFVEPRVRVAMMPHPNHGFDVALVVRGLFDRPYSGTDNIPPIMGNGLAATLRPLYVLKLKRLSLHAGVDAGYRHNNIWGQRQLSFWPAVDLRYNVAGGAFVPFFTSSGGTVDASSEALSRANPYYNPYHSGVGGPIGWRGELRAGFSGGVGGVFTYGLSGSFSKIWDHSLLTAIQRITYSGSSDSSSAPMTMNFHPLIFDVTTAQSVVFNLGVELGLHLGGFSVRVEGNFNHVEHDEIFAALFTRFIPASHLPRWDALAEISYRHRDRFTVRIGAKALGRRDFDTIWRAPDLALLAPDTIGPVVDLTAGAEVRVARLMWVFVDGSNLAGQRLYPYNHYRGLGATVMAGIKVVF